MTADQLLDSDYYPDLAGAVFVPEDPQERDARRELETADDQEHSPA